MCGAPGRSVGWDVMRRGSPPGPENVTIPDPSMAVYRVPDMTSTQGFVGANVIEVSTKVEQQLLMPHNMISPSSPSLFESMGIFVIIINFIC